MKTIFRNLISIFVFSLLCSFTVNAQSSELNFSSFTDDFSFSDVIYIDDLAEGGNLLELVDKKADPIDYVEVHDDPTIAYAAYMLGFGAGVGFGESQTLWCLQSAFYWRLAMMQKSAFYLALGAAYEGFSSDFVDGSLINLYLRGLFFTPITKYHQVQLVYGLLFAYGFGKEKFDSGDIDITRLTIGAVLGLNIILSSYWSLMLQTNIFTYQNTDFDDGVGSFSDNSTFFFLNKNNVLALTLIYNLSRRSQPE